MPAFPAVNRISPCRNRRCAPPAATWFGPRRRAGPAGPAAPNSKPLASRHNLVRGAADRDARVDTDLAAFRFAREPAELLPRAHVAHAVGRQVGRTTALRQVVALQGGRSGGQSRSDQARRARPKGASRFSRNAMRERKCPGSGFQRRTLHTQKKITKGFAATLEIWNFVAK
jgi:hypothetical protein